MNATPDITCFKIQPSTDPRYQYLMSMGSGEGGLRFTSANDGDIPVFARISDINSWQRLPQVQQGINIRADEENWLITARIGCRAFEELSRLPFVRNIAVSFPLMQPLLQNTLRDIGLVPNASIPSSILNSGGKGVVVGIVDIGCDFAHHHFIKPPSSAEDQRKRTRIHSIWDQSGVSGPNSPFGYGKIYARRDINRALESDQPYAALGYLPGVNPDGSIKDHGTHVMDIAAGNGPTPGIAPKAKIIFVNLAGGDRKLADSVCLVEAVKYIFDQAKIKNRPCVVNISLGQNGGAHDGTGFVEQALDAMVKEEPNRAIVIAAGNSYHDKSHYSSSVAQGSWVDVKWKIEPFDDTPNELEIWYSGKDEFEVEIIYTDGRTLARLPLDSALSFAINNNGKASRIAQASHRRKHPDNGDNVFQMFQDPRCDVAGGIWILRVHGKSIAGDGKFHAWIERDTEKGRSTLDEDHTSFTLNSIGTGHKTIVVGSYDARSSNKPISYFSSAGPTRDGRDKPEISAPGHLVWAARATSKKELVRMSGTSMAAPAATGLVARILEQAHKKDRRLNIDEIRELLNSSCQNTRANNEWDPRFGKGRLHANAILKVNPEELLLSPVDDDNSSSNFSAVVKKGFGYLKGLLSGLSDANSTTPLEHGLVSNISRQSQRPNFNTLAKEMNKIFSCEYQRTLTQTLGTLSMVDMLSAINEIFSIAEDVVNVRQSVLPGYSMVMGETGLGKSLFIGYAIGMGIRRGNPPNEHTFVYDNDQIIGPEIGHGASKTKGCKPFKHYIDTAGFSDSAGLEAEICNAAAVHMIAKSYPVKRLIVMLSLGVFDGRAQGFFALINRLKRIFRNPIDDSIWSSIFFVINNKEIIIDPATGKPIAKSFVSRKIKGAIATLEDELRRINLKSHGEGHYSDLEGSLTILKKVLQADNYLVANFLDDKTRAEIQEWENTHDQILLSKFFTTENLIENGFIKFKTSLISIATYFNVLFFKKQELNSRLASLKAFLNEKCTELEKTGIDSEDPAMALRAKKLEIIELQKEKKIRGQTLFRLSVDNSPVELTTLAPNELIQPSRKIGPIEISKTYTFRYNGIPLLEAKRNQVDGIFSDGQINLDDGIYECRYKPASAQKNNDAKIALFVRNKDHPSTKGTIQLITTELRSLNLKIIELQKQRSILHAKYLQAEDLSEQVIKIREEIEDRLNEILQEFEIIQLSCDPYRDFRQLVAKIVEKLLSEESFNPQEGDILRTFLQYVSQESM